MTLSDVGCLLRRNAKAMVAIPLVCALAAILYSGFIVGREYQAVSFVVPSAPVGVVAASDLASVAGCLAEDEVREKGYEEVEVESPLAKKSNRDDSVAILATAATEDEALDVANTVAKDVAERARNYYRQLFQGESRESVPSGSLSPETEMLLQERLMSEMAIRYCDFIVDEAAVAERVGASPVRLAIVAALCGVALAFGVILANDAFRRPLKKASDIRGVTNLPVLNDFAGADVRGGLWANVQFVAPEKGIRSLCLIPLSTQTSAQCGEHLIEEMTRSGRSTRLREGLADAGELLKASGDDIVVVQCRPLTCDVGAALIAREASATILCAEVWKDSVESLQDALRELSLAKANIVGIALLTSDRDL